jgi:hypothetical protein
MLIRRQPPGSGSLVHSMKAPRRVTLEYLHSVMLCCSFAKVFEAFALKLALFRDELAEVRL